MVFDDVLAELALRKAEFRELRYVPRDFIGRLKETGIYRSAAPARFGGEPLPPAEFLGLIERISVVDGSTGWVASFASALVYLAGLPEETQAELYRDGPDVVFAGGLFPVQPAVSTERGFVVDGRWKYASGCMGADVLGVGIQGGTEGKPRVAVLPPSQVEIVRDWDVVGMVGTGSFDLVVRGVEVPREWTFVRGGGSTIDEPLYRYPAIAYAAQVLAVVGAGVARAALDHALSAGAGYAGVTGAPRLADRPYYRAEVASCEAALRSARAWFYELSHEVWDTVVAGDDVSDEQNAHLRLSAAHLARTSSEVVGRLVEVSGTAVINSDHPLQLLFGDALVPKQHAFLGPAIYDAAGAVLMGLPPSTPGFR
ncbi:acyl-CoA dehydrogenase [Lentzea aerocolonigenes]|uniref:Acyl-CoA dehydrogenase n=1 Tax=Lentzea aerocolonigenes TaxID=68170 RepID=A0A0F0GWE5_LENAE|nr:acyl-CoA dehydrogenase family protein [Lentzea aerocolonigenes]KJK45748.1 acyl-CoA dehydrogenase [Lentzea aerocolonigenes]